MVEAKSARQVERTTVILVSNQCGERRVSQSLDFPGVFVRPEEISRVSPNAKMSLRANPLCHQRGVFPHVSSPSLTYVAALMMGFRKVSLQLS
jgi:hypothetical protein